MSNSAIIKTSSGKSVEEKNLSGLFTCLLEHKVTETAAKFNWVGPKISPKEWAQMMAFFEWTQETEKSESQVRAFVHPQHGWKFWAFPQEGGTSMTTKEIPCIEADEQRKQFGDGWEYFMTVHHHCTASAFQSGTDEADEKNVDGLHITIGHMDKDKRDIHCRLYIKGHRFEPMMDSFWQLDDALLKKAEECKSLWGFLPDLNTVARGQMALSSAILRPAFNIELGKDEPPFPELWKENYRVKKWNQGLVVGDYGNYYRGGGTFGKEWCVKCGGYQDHGTLNCPKDNGGKGSRSYKERTKTVAETPAEQETAMNDIVTMAALMTYDVEELLGIVEACSEHEQMMVVLFDEIAKNKIKLSDLEQHLNQLVAEAEMKEIKAQEEGIPSTVVNPHMTGWEGCWG